MTQLLLFDTPKRPARKRDPETSHIAAAEIETKLNVVQADFFHRLRVERTPMTANEVAQLCSKYGDGEHETYRKRAGELVELGRIEVCGKRKCKVTGKLAQVYKVKGGGK